MDTLHSTLWRLAHTFHFFLYSFLECCNANPQYVISLLYASHNAFLKIGHFESAWLAQLVEYVTFDLGVVSSRPTLLWLLKIFLKMNKNWIFSYNSVIVSLQNKFRWLSQRSVVSGCFEWGFRHGLYIPFGCLLLSFLEFFQPPFLFMYFSCLLLLAEPAQFLI